MLLFFHSVFMCPNARRTTPPCVLWSRIFGSIWRCTSRWYVTMTPASIRPASSWTICMAAAQSSTLSSGPPACYLEEPSSYSWSSSRSTFPYCVNKSAKPQSERGTVMDRLSEVKWSEVNVKWSEVKWSEVKWSEVKWSECEVNLVKWSEVKWMWSELSEVKWSEVKWSEVKWMWSELSEVKWSEVKWSEVKWMNVKWT